MGIELVKWVLDEAPGELTHAELVALLALAEWARDETGMCWPKRAKIARRMRRSESSADRALRSLVGRGLVEIVRPAAPGRTPQYRLNARHDVTHVDAGTCVISEPNVRHSGHERASSNDAQNPQSPQEPSDPRARDTETAAVIKALRDRTGKTVDEAHAALVIRQLIGDRRNVAHRIPYLRGAIAKDPDPSRFLPTGSPPPFRREDYR